MPVLSGLLDHHGRYRGDYPALDFEGATWTFAELNCAVNRLANALLCAGLKKGDRFATVLPNSVELMTAYWAAAVSGLVIVPCSMLLQENGLKTLLNDSGVRLVLVGKHQIAAVDGVRDQLEEIAEDRFIAVSDQSHAGYCGFDDFIVGASSDKPEIEIAESDIYNIMYSSGTTGLPKGIIHTHQIRSMYCILFAGAWRMSPESVVLHAGAIVFNGAMLDLMPWMYLGCRYILHRSFNAERMIEDIEQQGVTHVVLVPAQIIAILNSPEYRPERLATLEMIHNVGAPLHLNYKKIINADLPNRFYELYGVTEGFMTILDRTEAVTKEGSVGKPASFNEVVVLDAEGVECPIGKVGEICGKGPMVMPGYHNRPELTREAFVNGWLRSGDLGYMDAGGYVYLVDRKKDMIISGGVNVYPRDIEELIMRHSAIREVAVFGVADEKWGEVPMASVTLKSTISSEELVDWVNQRVDARFQRVKDVQIVEDFPRNVAGKILKRQLQADYQK